MARRPVSSCRSRFRCATHYIKTLRIWGDALEANKDKAIEITSEEVYERYMKYLRGAEYYFNDEMLDVSLVTYLKPGAAA